MYIYIDLMVTRFYHSLALRLRASYLTSLNLFFHLQSEDNNNQYLEKPLHFIIQIIFVYSFRNVLSANYMPGAI